MKPCNFLVVGIVVAETMQVIRLLMQLEVVYSNCVKQHPLIESLHLQACFLMASMAFVVCECRLSLTVVGLEVLFTFLLAFWCLKN